MLDTLVVSDLVVCVMFDVPEVNGIVGCVMFDTLVVDLVRCVVSGEDEFEVMFISVNVGKLWVKYDEFQISVASVDGPCVVFGTHVVVVAVVVVSAFVIDDEVVEIFWSQTTFIYSASLETVRQKNT